MNPLARLALWFALVASALAQPATLADRLKSAVIRVDQTRLAAMETVHLDGLMELMTDDCIYAHSTGQKQTKAEMIAALQSGALKYHSIRYEGAPTVRLYGDGAAVLNAVTLIDAEMRGSGRIQRKLLVTAVYVTQGMQWRLASYHSSTIPDPAPAK
jgi:uncharacterized protein (TIGR02246 family)